MNVSSLLKPILAVVSIGFLGNVYAHTGHGPHNDHAMMTAFIHPFEGWDHLLTMLAVGLLAVKSQTVQQRIMLPFVFLICLLVSSLLALAFQGTAFSGMELSLALSVTLCGLALLASAPHPSHTILVASLGLLHGWAHGIELLTPGQPSALLTITGMLLGSLCLHAIGLLLGTRLHTFQRSRLIERTTSVGLISTGILMSFVA